MLISSYPQQTVLITTRLDDKDNVMTVDWHMPCSHKPELYAISIGNTRYTKCMIDKSGVFIVNFLSPDHEQLAVDVGTHSGAVKDKFKMFNIEKEPGDRVDAPKVKVAVAYLECKVVNKLETGDHTIFIGEVLHRDIDHVSKRLLHLNPGNYFTTTVD